MTAEGTHVSFEHGPLFPPSDEVKGSDVELGFVDDDHKFAERAPSAKRLLDAVVLIQRVWRYRRWIRVMRQIRQYKQNREGFSFVSGKGAAFRRGQMEARNSNKTAAPLTQPHVRTAISFLWSYVSHKMFWMYVFASLLYGTMLLLLPQQLTMVVTTLYGASDAAVDFEGLAGWVTLYLLMVSGLWLLRKMTSVFLGEQVRRRMTRHITHITAHHVKLIRRDECQELREDVGTFSKFVNEHFVSMWIAVASIIAAIGFTMYYSVFLGLLQLGLQVFLLALGIVAERANRTTLHDRVEMETDREHIWAHLDTPAFRRRLGELRRLEASSANLERKNQLKGLMFSHLLATFVMLGPVAIILVGGYMLDNDEISKESMLSSFMYMIFGMVYMALFQYSRSQADHSVPSLVRLKTFIELTEDSVPEEEEDEAAAMSVSESEQMLSHRHARIMGGATAAKKSSNTWVMIGNVVILLALFGTGLYLSSSVSDYTSCENVILTCQSDITGDLGSFPVLTVETEQVFHFTEGCVFKSSRDEILSTCAAALQAYPPFTTEYDALKVETGNNFEPFDVAAKYTGFADTDFYFRAIVNPSDGSFSTAYQHFLTEGSGNEELVSMAVEAGATQEDLAKAVITSGWRRRVRQIFAAIFNCQRLTRGSRDDDKCNKKCKKRFKKRRRRNTDLARSRYEACQEGCQAPRDADGSFCTTKYPPINRDERRKMRACRFGFKRRETKIDGAWSDWQDFCDTVVADDAPNSNPSSFSSLFSLSSGSSGSKSSHSSHSWKSNPWWFWTSKSKSGKSSSIGSNDEAYDVEDYDEDEAEDLRFEMQTEAATESGGYFRHYLHWFWIFGDKEHPGHDKNDPHTNVHTYDHPTGCKMDGTLTIKDQITGIPEEYPLPEGCTVQVRTCSNPKPQGGTHCSDVGVSEELQVVCNRSPVTGYTTFSQGASVMSTGEYDSEYTGSFYGYGFYGEGYNTETDLIYIIDTDSNFGDGTSYGYGLFYVPNTWDISNQDNPVGSGTAPMTQLSAGESTGVESLMGPKYSQKIYSHEVLPSVLRYLRENME